MSKTDLKIISEKTVDPAVASVKPPFKIRQDGQRRYIRLEISEPVSYSVLKDRNGRFSPGAERPYYTGSLLNISAGGMLIVSENMLEEGTIIFLKIFLQEIEVLDNIIAVVKRAEMDAGDWLIGVEFISREHLSDHLSEAELQVLPENAASFDERVKMALNKYIFYQKVARENKQQNA